MHEKAFIEPYVKNNIKTAKLSAADKQKSIRSLIPAPENPQPCRML